MGQLVRPTVILTQGLQRRHVPRLADAGLVLEDARIVANVLLRDGPDDERGAVGSGALVPRAVVAARRRCRKELAVAIP